MRPFKAGIGSIRAKLNLIIVVVNFVTLFTLAATSWMVVEKIVREQMLHDATSMASMLAYNSRAALVFRDKAGAEKVLQSLKSNPDVLRAAILDSSLRPFANFPTDESKGLNTKGELGSSSLLSGKGYMFLDNKLLLLEPVRMDQAVIGSIFLELSLEKLKSSLDRVIATVGSLVLFALLLAFVLSELLQKFISEPIKKMAKLMRQISKDKDYSRRIDHNSNDETGLLAASFNEMLKEIEAWDTHLEKMVEERTRKLRLAVERAFHLAKEAEQASQAKSRFLANMSHELRTPLNAVIGMAELALASPLTKEQARYIEAVHEAGNTLLSLINDILDFSKIEAGELKLDIHSFSIRELCEEVATVVARAVPEKGVDIYCYVDSAVPERVLGDSHKLRHVLLNLMGNAAKFTEKGWVALECTMKADESKGPNIVTLGFRIIDTGIGIPTDKLDTIFDAFSQADTSVTRKHGGTGLGLSISSKLVGLMGGLIKVESEPGKGSQFSFDLAFEKADFTIQVKDPLRLELHRLSKDFIVAVVDKTAWGEKVAKGLLAPIGFEVIGADDYDGLFSLLKERQGDKGVIAIIHEEFVAGGKWSTGDKRGEVLANQDISIIVSCRSPSALGACQGMSNKAVVCCLPIPIVTKGLFKCLVVAMKGGETETKWQKTTHRGLKGSYSGSVSAKILLVEDTLMNQEVIKGIIETKTCHRLSVASEGKEALRLLSEEDFDLILMDIQMPGMDGITTCKIIRSIEAGKKPSFIADLPNVEGLEKRLSGGHIPIIAMTAHAFSEDRYRCMDAGMDDYISKPFKLEDILRILSMYVPEKDKDMSNEGCSLTSGSLPHRGEDAAGSTGDIDVERIKRHIKAEFGLGDDVLEEVFSAALDSFSDNIRGAEVAIATMDFDGMLTSFHTLKGVLATLDLTDLRDLAFELETAARNKKEMDYKRRLNRIKQALSPLLHTAS